ncbi:unnamed protein product [Urochloa humidicola]
MASTAAALMRTVVATRRLSRSATAAAAATVPRPVSGSHKLSINGCQLLKNLDQGWAWDSKPFRVGGHSWRLKYHPNGHEGHISLYLGLDRGSAIDAASNVMFRFSLLDQSGIPVPKFTRTSTQAFSFHGFSLHHGFHDFIKWEDLEESGCLKNDTFTVQCDLAFTTDLGSSNDGAAPASSACAAPAVLPKLHGKHLADPPWMRVPGADVSIDVGGDATFNVHGWLLAQRSPGLQAELLATSNSKKSNAAAAAHRRIEIKDMEPKVFEAVLYYMYTNALPETMEDADHDAMMAMAKGLLAAENRFKMEGLKLACEEVLSKCIEVGTAAGTLAVAEQHGCKTLKDACLEFMARQGNLKAVMETEGYEKAKPTIYPLVVELVMKQWMASSAAHHE